MDPSSPIVPLPPIESILTHPMELLLTHSIPPLHNVPSNQLDNDSDDDGLTLTLYSWRDHSHTFQSGWNQREYEFPFNQIEENEIHQSDSTALKHSYQHVSKGSNGNVQRTEVIHIRITVPLRLMHPSLTSVTWVTD
jgi:hypothetical protein